MPFDIKAALDAGYTPAQVADYLGPKRGFDVTAARKAGYDDQQIVDYLGQAKSGFAAATKAGWHGALGSAEKYLGELSGSESLKQSAEENKAKARGEFAPTTSEDVANVKGILPTASNWLSQKVTEPVGGIVGSFGAPVAAAAATPFILPEAAAGALGATGVAALSAGVGTLAGLPTQAGENLERQESLGQKPNLVNATAAGLFQSALMNVSIPGMGAATKGVSKLIGEPLQAQAEKMAQKVIDGEVSHEAAVKSLGGYAQQLAQNTATNAITGSTMMVGTEAARRAQAGQDLTGSEAMQAYGENVKGALELSPLFGVIHGIGQRGHAEAKLADAKDRNDIINNVNAYRAQRSLELTQLKEDNRSALEAAYLEADEKQRQQINDNIYSSPDKSIMDIINDVTGVNREPANISRQKLDAWWNMPSGRRVSDPETGHERELTRGELHKILNPEGFAEEPAPAPELTKQDVLPLQSSIEQAHEVQKAGTTQQDLFNPVELAPKPIEAPLTSLPELKQQEALPLETNIGEVRSMQTMGSTQGDFFNPPAMPPLPKLDEHVISTMGFRKNSPGFKALLGKDPLADATHIDKVFEANKNLKTLNPEVVNNYRSVVNAYRQAQEPRVSNEPGPTGRVDQPSILISEQRGVGATGGTEGPATRDVGDVGVPPVQPERGARVEPSPLESKPIKPNQRHAQKAFDALDTGVKFEQLDDTLRTRVKDAHADDYLKTEAPEIAKIAKRNAIVEKQAELVKEEPEVEQAKASSPAKTEFSMNDLPKQDYATAVHTIPEGTKLYHGTHGDRANEIEANGLLLKSRNEFKSSGGTMDEGGLLWFADKPTAKEFADSKADPFHVSAKERKYGPRKPGKVFETVAERPLRLIHKDYKLSQAEADALNEALGLPEYKHLEAGYDVDLAASRAHNYQASNIERYKTQDGEMSAPWPVILKTLNVDGIYHGSGIALSLDKIKSSKIEEARGASVNGHTSDSLRSELTKEFGEQGIKSLEDRGILNIHDSVEHAPEHIRNAVESDAIGAHSEGTTHLFADRIAKGEGRRGLLHEVGEHYGLKGMVGDTAYANILDQMGKTAHRDPVIKAAVEHVLTNYPELKDNPERFAREVVARVGESAPTHTLWRKLVAAVKNFLVKYGLKKNISGADIHDLVQHSLRTAMKRDIEAPRAQAIEAAKKGKEATRLDGSPIKQRKPSAHNYPPAIERVINGEGSMWQRLAHELGAARNYIGTKVISKQYNIQRKALDKGIASVSAKEQGELRGDLVALAGQNSSALAHSGMELGGLRVMPSGLIEAYSDATNPLSLLDVTDSFHKLVERATKDVGHVDTAHDMISMAWIGPRYEDIIRNNERLDRAIDSIKTSKPEGYQEVVAQLEKQKRYVGDWTDKDRAAAAEAEKRYGPELAEMRAKWNTFRERLMKFMVETHIMDEDTAKEYLDNVNYVPFYRIHEEEEAAGKDYTPLTGSSLQNAGKQYRFKGSDKEQGDPITNMTANVSWMMQKAIQNNSAIHLAKLEEQMGEGHWATPAEAHSGAGHQVTIWKDGHARKFVLDDINDMAAFAGNPIIQGWMWNVSRKFTSALRHGVTMFPQFVFNQAFEDPIRATFVSGNKAGFLNNLANTWKSVFMNEISGKHTPGAEALYRSGVIGQKDVMNEQDVIKRYKGQEKSGVKKAMFLFERLAQGSDLGARESIYNNAMKELKDQGYDQATAHALAVTRAVHYMPHQQVGTSRTMAYLRAMIPFVNSPIQGYARDIAAARGRIDGVSKEQGKKMLAFRLTKYASFIAAYAAMRSGDPSYENQDPDQRDNYFFIGGLRIPAPQELRGLKAAIERGTRAYALNAPGADLGAADIGAAVLRKHWEMVSNLVLPVPTVARPILENITNYNLHSNRPLVSAGLSHQESRMQFNQGTSEIGKMIGDMLNVSPIKVDNFISGYGGYFGQTIEKFSNALVEGRPTQNVNDWLFVGTMAEPEYATGPISEAYKLNDKVTEVKATMKALKEQGNNDRLREYMQENKGWVGMDRAVTNIHQQITNVRRLQNQIANSNMDPDEKRSRINQLKANEIEKLQQVHELHRRIEEANNS